MPETPNSFPKCECGGIALDNASGDITRTCIRCGRIVKPQPPQAAVGEGELPPLNYKSCQVAHPEAQRKYGGNLTQYRGDFLIQREAQLREAIAQRDEARSERDIYREMGDSLEAKLAALDVGEGDLPTRVDFSNLLHELSTERDRRKRVELMNEAMGVFDLVIAQRDEANRRADENGTTIGKLVDTLEAAEAKLAALDVPKPRAKGFEEWAAICGLPESQWEWPRRAWRDALASMDVPKPNEIEGLLEEIVYHLYDKQDISRITDMARPMLSRLRSLGKEESTAKEE